MKATSGGNSPEVRAAGAGGAEAGEPQVHVRKAAEAPGPPPWPWATRFAFRFFFVYFLVYINPFFAFQVTLPPPAVAVLEPVMRAYQDAWTGVINWAGDLFSWDVSVLPAGSGDTRYNYVQVLICAAFAAAVALLWSVLWPRPATQPRLHGLLRIYLRFWLGTTMIAYGANKVIKLQFPDPSFDRLLQPLGEYSPFSLLWTFMGASEVYTNFTGAAEVLGGVLLFARRTTTLGALVCIGVLSNVVMLNLCYDVPVKLFSSHLLAAAVFLAAPDARRLARVLVLNRPTEPRPLWRLFQNKWLHRGALALRTAFVLGFVAVTMYRMYEIRKAIDEAPRSPLYGVWEVEDFQRDGKTVPPLLTDQTRWRRVVADRPFFNRGTGAYVNTLTVQLIGGARRPYVLELDEAKGSLTLTPWQAPKRKAVFSWRRPAPDRLVLSGRLDGHPVRATLRRRSDAFPLTSRGFHWINDRPYAR
jgi:hypothetical protein